MRVSKLENTYFKRGGSILIKKLLGERKGSESHSIKGKEIWSEKMLK